MSFAVMDTPVGALTLNSTSQGLSTLSFGMHVPPGGTVDSEANRVFTRQIEEYFQGARTVFNFPLDLKGTPFQLAVWRELLNIPYGQTRTYGQVAQRLGKPQAARAVGMANHENPIAIVIPCHRVIGRDGSLTGYASGLRIKEQLLTLESQTRTS